MASLEGWDLPRFREQLRLHARRLRRDPRIAVRFDESDLVQDTLQKAVAAKQGPPPGADETHCFAWLVAILNNRLKDLFNASYAGIRDVRREQQMAQAIDESSHNALQGFPDSSDSPSEKAASHERDERVASAIQQLPPPQPEIVLRRKQGHTFGQIEADLGLAEGSARPLYLQALKTLRQQLGGDQP